MTDRFESMRKAFNESQQNMSKEDVVEFTRKVFDYGIGREEANVSADDFVANLLTTQQKEIDGLKQQSEIIEHNQKPISYDEVIKVVADTYDMSVDDYEHLFAKGNDYLQVDALSKEITGSSLWDHRNCNFDGFEKVEDKENETPELTPEHIKALGFACGTIQRLFSEGVREGLKEVSE